MTRRTLLQGVAVGAAAAITGRATRSARGAGTPALITSPDSGPTSADWIALAHSIEGDVLQRTNPAYPRAKQLFNPRFDSVAPLAVVQALNASDVQQIINFAHKFTLQPRGKAGGHSYVGASTVQNGLVIDVSRITFAQYYPGSRVASVGAGAKLFPVHQTLAGHGRTIPTGTCPTVGAAGLTLGGGLGVASREYGLTCDSLTGITMVTADGQIRVVNRDSFPDLFWAHRGGGGGNFGVVTSMRFNTQPALPMGFFLIDFPYSHASNVVRGWAARIKAMPNTVWANLHLEASSNGTAQVRIVGVCRAGAEAGQALAMESAIGVAPSSVSTFSKSFLDGITFLGGGTTSPRTGFAAGSDVLVSMPDSLSTSLPALVARRAASHQSAAVILDPLTGAVQHTLPGASAFPYRRHLASVQWYVGMPAHPTPGQLQSTYDWIGTGHATVRASSAGGYVNYLEPRRAVSSYYGANYARLQQVKRVFDPSGFFDFAFGIQ